MITTTLELSNAHLTPEGMDHLLAHLERVPYEAVATERGVMLSVPDPEGWAFT